MMNVLEKIDCIVLSLGILGQAYVVRLWVGSWIFPACLYGLFWFLYTFVPLVAIFTAPVHFMAMVYILASCLAFSAGALFFSNWRESFWVCRERGAAWPGLYGSRFVMLVFASSCAAAIIFWLINSVIQGITLKDLVFNFFESAAAYSNRRYAEDIVSNFFSQFANVLSYLGATLGGCLFQSLGKSHRGKRAAILFVAMLPSLFVMLTQSAKGMLFLSLSLFFAGVLIVKLHSGEARLGRKGALQAMLLGTACLIPIVSVSFMTRGLYGTADTDFIVQQVFKMFASYSFTHLYAFSDWFGWLFGEASFQYYTKESLDYGFFTFMPILKMFGNTKELPLGTFDEYFSYRDILQSNIYTHYRGLIDDFGLMGSLVAMFAAGLVCHFTFNRLLRSPGRTASAAAFVIMIGYFYMSFGISLLIYLSVYATFLALGAVFYANAIIYRNGAAFAGQGAFTTPGRTRAAWARREAVRTRLTAGQLMGNMHEKHELGIAHMMSEPAPQSRPAVQPYPPAGPFDLRTVSGKLWAQRISVGSIAGAVIALGILYLHLASYNYSARLMLVPTQGQNQTLSGQLTDLASVAGINLGKEQNVSPFLLYPDVVKSRAVAEELVRHDPAIVHTLFAAQWDAQANRWKPPSGVMYGIAQAAKMILGVPLRAWAPPGAGEVQKYIERNVVIEQNTKRPIITLNYDNPDPVFARQLVQAVHDAADRVLRRMTLDRASKYAAYIEDKLAHVQLTELRQVLVNSLSQQETLLMMSSSDTSFAAQPLGQAESSLKPTTPVPLFVLFLCTVIGFILGAAIVYFDIPVSRWIAGDTVREFFNRHIGWRPLKKQMRQ